MRNNANIFFWCRVMGCTTSNTGLSCARNGDSSNANTGGNVTNLANGFAVIDFESTTDGATLSTCIDAPSTHADVVYKESKKKHHTKNKHSAKPKTQWSNSR